jgi:phosphohistidine swiveling domain-containing protein
MNVLRKAMAREVEELKPLLDTVYASILAFQRDRTPAHGQAMRDAMGPAIERLMIFRPLLPAYKQADFDALRESWRHLSSHDLIMLFDHCVNIMHVHLERKRSTFEAQQPWTAELAQLLDSYRESGPITALSGEHLCSGIAASGGRAEGRARVVPESRGMDGLQRGEILVTRFALPDLAPYFPSLSALVTDEGGELAHAAILAREHHLPAVTGCGNATSVIETGDVILVDGDFGLVNSV